MSAKIDWSRADWRKSSRSANGSDCVEIAVSSRTIGVRDSKNPYNPVLEFTPTEWATFAHDVKAAKLNGRT